MTVERLRRHVGMWVPTQTSGVPFLIRWRAALSNVDWTEYAHGLGACFLDHNGDRSLMLCDVDQLHRSEARAEQCLYIVDDGVEALPYMVASWCFVGPCADDIPDGYLRLRRIHPHAPNGGYGPRRAWHLLVAPVDEEVC